MYIYMYIPIPSYTFRCFHIYVFFLFSTWSNQSCGFFVLNKKYEHSKKQVCYMCITIHIVIYVLIHIYIYTHIYIYIYIHIYEHKFRCKSLSMSNANIFIDVYIYICMKKYTQVCLYIYIMKRNCPFTSRYILRNFWKVLHVLLFLLYIKVYIYIYVYAFETPYVNIMTSGTLAKQDGTATFICSSHPHGLHFNTVYNIKT